MQPATDAQHEVWPSNFDRLGAKYVPPTRKEETQHERDAALLTELLAKVSDSVSTFRPSPSLAFGLGGAGGAGSAGSVAAFPEATSTTSLQQLARSASELFAEPKAEPSPISPDGEEVDMVISGGGLKGYFVIGARAVLETQFERRNLKIRRYAGCSAGSWAAMFMATGVSNADWLKTYTNTRHAIQAGDSSRILEAYRDQILPWLSSRLPADAWKRCCGRCFISITVLDRFGMLPRNVMISEYTSNEDLVNACFASSCIPFVVEAGLGPRFRGLRVVDGGFTNNVPCFRDGLRRQMVVCLENVQYDVRSMVLPRDPCIEALALNGALMMARFLEGRECGDAIQWGRAGGGVGILHELLPAPLAAFFANRRFPGLTATATAAVLATLALRLSRTRVGGRMLKRRLVLALGLAVLYLRRDATKEARGAAATSLSASQSVACLKRMM